MSRFKKKAFRQLATVNTPKGRVKDRNMRRDPRVSLDMIDLDNACRHLSIRGRVAEIMMAKKYFNVDRYPNRQPGECE
jgi:hypothetical protein